MRILFLSRWFPFPADNGSKIRIFSLLRRLSRAHEIHLVSFTEGDPTPDSLDTMLELCETVHTCLYRPFRPATPAALLGLLSPRPRSVVSTYSAEMCALVDRVAGDFPPDLVIASEIDTVPYATRVPDAPRVLEDLELSALHDLPVATGSYYRRARQRLTWWKASRYVANILRSFDACTVVSSREEDLVRRAAPDYRRIRILPNGVEPAHCTATFGPPKPDTLVYPGALTYSANFDAMAFFLRDVFPLVRARRSQVRLLITGDYDPASASRLPLSNGVVLTGRLDDVRPTVAESWVCVVPIRVGAGTRLKILEAMALGTPVVSTRKGAEGLDLVAESDLLIADEPAQFADAILRLLADADLRQALGTRGRKIVKTRYNWDSIGEELCNLVGDVAADARRARQAMPAVA